MKQAIQDSLQRVLQFSVSQSSRFRVKNMLVTCQLQCDHLSLPSCACAPVWFPEQISSAQKREFTVVWWPVGNPNFPQLPAGSLPQIYPKHFHFPWNLNYQLDCAQPYKNLSALKCCNLWRLFESIQMNKKTRNQWKHFSQLWPALRAKERSCSSIARRLVNIQWCYDSFGKNNFLPTLQNCPNRQETSRNATKSNPFGRRGVHK